MRLLPPVGALKTGAVQCLTSRRFPPDNSYFKKQQQEKQLRRPRRDGDDESLEDVDDDEFERLLGGRSFQ